MTETTDSCACNDSNNGCDSDTHYALSFHCPGQYDINFKGNFEGANEAACSANTTDTTDTTDTTNPVGGVFSGTQPLLSGDTKRSLPWGVMLITD